MIKSLTADAIMLTLTLTLGEDRMGGNKIHLFKLAAEVAGILNTLGVNASIAASWDTVTVDLRSGRDLRKAKAALAEMVAA